MALVPWTIQESRSIVKSLQYYKADKAVSNNYHRLVDELPHLDNPANMGIPKKGRYSGCIGAHITKSVVVVYRIDHAAHRIDLLKMGDHKMVYGSDG